MHKDRVLDELAIMKKVVNGIAAHILQTEKRLQDRWSQSDAMTKEAFAELMKAKAALDEADFLLSD